MGKRQVSSLQLKVSKFQRLVKCRFLDFNNLPTEILIECLIRLPVLDLARASLTCKAWNSIISNSEFVELHLKQSAKRLIYLYSFDSKFENFLEGSTISNKKAEVERIRKGGLRDLLKPRMNSSGGLLAYTVENDNFCYICNPFTGEEVRIAMGPFWGKDFLNNWCGLGYSVASKEYKILLLAFPRTGGGIVSQSVTKGAIYTVGAGSEWREIPGNIPYCICPCCRPLDFEGSLFFFAFRSCVSLYAGPVCIVSFDFESERFRLWNSPSNADMHVPGSLYMRLLSIGGVVAFAQINSIGDDTGVSIWMLRDKVNEIWVKEINITVLPVPRDRLVRMNIFGECATSNSKFPCILLSFYNGLVVYDTKDNSFKYIVPGRVGQITAKCIAHTESFVSPKRIMATVLAAPGEI